MLTENGWPQISKPVTGPVPGLGDVNIESAGGDVRDILCAWMVWFDRNVEDIETNFLPRDEWGWSSTNSVWNSNHLSGTAVDINATKYPMGYYKMEAWKVDRVNEGLRLFGGVVFWGRVWDNPDEMHFQIQGNAAQIAPMAQRLRDGYLNLLAPETPKDPNAFPLPEGYVYGPLDGPNNYISGEYKSDSQESKDALGRWQVAVGIPETKRWDSATANAVIQLQQQKGWDNPDNPFRGLLYVGEWNAGILEGWRYSAGQPVVSAGVYWADVSKYQQIPVDNSYPHRVFCFRVNTGNEIDSLADANYREACRMADEGRLDVIIAYSFFRPHSAGHATWDTFKNFILERGIHSKLVVMVDVEDGKSSPLGEVVGDQSYEANGFIDLAGLDLFQGDRKPLLGYHNFKANPGMWLSLPQDLKMIRPNYSIPPGKGNPDGAQLFAHQFTQQGRCAPWGDRNVDLNFYPGSIEDLIRAFGKDAKPEVIVPTPIPQPDPPGRKEIVLKPGEQLSVRAE